MQQTAVAALSLLHLFALLTDEHSAPGVFLLGQLGSVWSSVSCLLRGHGWDCHFRLLLQAILSELGWQWVLEGALEVPELHPSASLPSSLWSDSVS